MLYLYLAASSRRLGHDGGAVAGGGRGHDQGHVVDFVLADEVRLLSSEVLGRRESYFFTMAYDDVFVFVCACVYGGGGACIYLCYHHGNFITERISRMLYL